MNEPRANYVVDARGHRVGVVLNIRQYRKILDALEELESVRAYDAAKATRDEAVPFEQAVQSIERRRK